MTANHTRLLALLSAILVAAALRLVPHPPNFTPIGAMALFSGAYLGRPRARLRCAARRAASQRRDPRLLFGMPSTYCSVALVVLIGWAGSSASRPVRIGAAAIASSLLFFVVTNFGIWL